VTGGTDTTTAYTYNGNSTGQPHTLTSASSTGGSSSSSTFGYDPAGNMTARTTPSSGAQTLAWNEAGQLASVTGSAGTTSYLYTPDGDLLLRKDPTATTLFLPGEQLTLTTAGAESGIRYIPLPSGGRVVRTGDNHQLFTSRSRTCMAPAPCTWTTRPRPRPGASSPRSVRPAVPRSPGSTRTAS
jgi:YD repeat-containing protein